MDSQKIERFATGGERLRRGVEGLSPADIVARPGPGAWSILECVIHIADMDGVAIDRMKRIIAEDSPRLLSADEDRYAARLHYHEQSLDDALNLIDLGRRQFARVLRKLDGAEFARTGTHSVKGPVSVADIVDYFTNHVDHHLDFILRKRITLGKPLT